MATQLIITRTASLDEYLTETRTDLVPHREARDCWAEFRAARDYTTPRVDYMTRENHNKKTKLNRIPTISWTGAPARTGVRNACTDSTIACRNVCIRYTGRLDFPYAIQVGRDRIEFLRLHPDEACSLIHWETMNLTKRYPDQAVARRLNLVTDLRFEDFAPWLFTEAPESVVTYDYTKHWDRDPEPADRYRLTFSANEYHTPDDIREMTDSGRNVAVVFPSEYKDTPYPDQWFGIPLINGDLTDFRYEDPAGVIVGLYAKGRAKHIIPGMDQFVKPVSL